MLIKKHDEGHIVELEDGSRVRVIEASNDWPVAQVRRSLKEG